MSFIEKKEDDILIINVNGDVDLENSDSLREQVSAALESNSAVSVNMSEVSYIDSSGIAALIESRQKAEEANKVLKFKSQ